MPRKIIREIKDKMSYFGVRHLQCFLLFLGLSVSYAIRVNLFVAIVAMTDKNETINADLQKFHYDWSEKTKSFILSSFFWGYIVTQIPAGYLASRYGGKDLLCYGILISSILSFFTPIFVHLGNWQLLCIVRAVQGLSQGVVFPCTHAILSNWAPIEERGALCAFTYAGTLFGIVVMFALSGLLASSQLGWPGIFYIAGVLGLAWILVWSIWGANEPREYLSLASKERQRIEASISCQSIEMEKKRKTYTETPWRKMLTSPAVIVLIIAHCAHNWGFWTMLTQIPTYVKVILHKDIKSNALLSALPYLAMFLLSFVFSILSTLLGKSDCVTMSTSRKILNTIGQWCPMMTLLALTYITADNVNTAVILLTLTVGFNAASFPGFQVNHLDLSSTYAGVLMGITNAAAHVMSIVAPLIVGVVVSNERNPDQWHNIFYITAGFYFIGNLLFLLFGKAVEQSWSDAMVERPKAEKQSLTEVPAAI